MNTKVSEYKHKIELNGKVIHTLPDTLLSLQKAIEKSKYILDLQPDWDGEGAETYTDDAWTKAVSFLCEFSIDIFNTFGKTPVTPVIYHGPEGSIDILWKTEDLNLLLNIPKDDQAATFSGENSLGQEYEGSLNINNYSLSFYLIHFNFIMWEIEPIPDDALLYYRVHKGYIVEGQLIPGVFKERGEGENRGMSTDWNKYSTAEEAHSRSRNPVDNGIISFIAGEIREIKDIIAEHAPEPDNRAHSHIKGIPPKKPMKTRIRRQLLDACKWEIKPE